MTQQEFIIRLAVVIAVGFLIGMERQLTGHAVGMKTTILIAIGTFAFVSVEAIIGSNDARMAANIITGIGFLCSGVIFKNGLTVNGLNTSATLWGTAAISVLAGYGYIVFALISTGALVVFNLVLPFISKLIKPIPCFVDADNEDVFFINVVCLKVDVPKVKQIVTENIGENITLESIQTSGITADKFRVKAKICSSTNHVAEISSITDKIFDSDVLSVTWEKDTE